MNRKTLAALAVTLALAAPAAAFADPVDLTLEAWGGWKRFDALGLKDGVTTAANDSDLLKGSNNAIGADAIVKLSILELGALYEGGVNYKTTNTRIVGGLLGVGADISLVRLELLGEVGGQQYRNIAGSGYDKWFPYVGFRPGVSLRLPIADPIKLVLGVWGFARWDVSSTTVDVLPGTAVGGTMSRYDVGGSTFGVVGRVGIEI